MTPPGAARPDGVGAGLSSAKAGSRQGLFVVADVVAARGELAARGVEVGEVQHIVDGAWVPGPDPGRANYMSFAEFSDPDGNRWLLQEVTNRLPGRVDATETSFASPGDLAEAMRRASVAHGEHEARTGQADANWPVWYASYMVAEQAGTDLPT